MKKTLLAAPAFVVLFALTSCPGVFETAPPSGPVTGETGFVSLRFGASMGRTLLPDDFAFAEYEITFTPLGPADDRAEVVVPRSSRADAYELGVGDWALYVRTFLTPAAVNATASGGAEFTVTADVTTSVRVPLNFVSMTGTGAFSWAIVNETGLPNADLNRWPNQLEIILEPLGGEAVEGNWLNPELTGSAEDIVAGFYLVSVRLEMDAVTATGMETFTGARRAVWSDVLHVYPGQTTHIAHTFGAGDFFHGIDRVWLFSHMTDWNLDSLYGKEMARQPDGTFVWSGNLWAQDGGYSFRFSLTDTSYWTPPTEENRRGGAWLVPNVDSTVVPVGVPVRELELMPMHHGYTTGVIGQGVNRSWTIDSAAGNYSITLDTVERALTVERLGPVALENVWLVGIPEWNLPGTPMTRETDAFVWEGDVAASGTFRFSLTDTTDWYDGNWLAPVVNNTGVNIGGGVPVTFFDANPGTAWYAAQEGWYRFAVNPVTMNLYVERPVIVDEVIVRGPNSVAVGSTSGAGDFAATVIGRNNPAQTVTWTLTGAQAGDTSIDPNTGVLRVSANETAQTVTVIATSAVSPLLSGSVQVFVTRVDPLPPVAAGGIILDAKGVAAWTWNHPDQNAYLAGFRLQLYREVTAGVFVPVDTGVAGSLVTVAAGVRSLSFASAMRTAGVNTYTVTVTAVSNDTNSHWDSAPTRSNAQSVTQRPQVEHSWWLRNGIARWVNPPSAGPDDSFRVELLRNGNPVSEGPITVPRGSDPNPGNPAETITSVDFAWEGFSANSAALYSFTVTVMSDGELTIDAEPSAAPEPRNFSVLGYTAIHPGGVAARVWTIAEGGTGNNRRYVAGAAGGRIAWSRDGVTWTLASQGATPTAIFGANDVRAVAHSPGLGSPGFGRFVAVGHGGRAAFSDDGGGTWSAMDTANGFGTTSILSIAYGNGRFIAAGDSGFVRSSLNGQTWNTITGWQLSTILDGGAVVAMMFDGQRFVAFARNPGNWPASGQHAWSATGTENWTWIGNQLDGANRNVLNGAVSGAGTFVIALANEGFIPRFSALPPNWLWSEHQVGAANIRAVGYGHGRFVAVGANGMAGISVNQGASWTPLANPFGTGEITAAYGMENGNVILAGPGRFAVVTP